MTRTTTVQMMPYPSPAMIGGVMVHCRALIAHLERKGWTVTGEPTPGSLVHTHAIDRAPTVDVYTNHGIYPITSSMPEWQADANRRIFDNLKMARKVIAVSEWTANQWKHLTGVKPTIIPNGIDLDQWDGVPTGYWRGKLEAGSRPIVLWGKQSVSDVLDPGPAIGLALRRPDILVVAPLRASMLRTAPENFRMTGPLSFENMQRLIADCDVYLATVQENHSIQVLEAMALYRPILGYRWGGTAETITSGTDGVLVEPGDIDALADHLDLMLSDGGRIMGARAGQTVEDRYQWTQIIDRVLEVYEQALDEREADEDAKRPVCSIVIPVYNKAAFVGDAIRSAAAQVGAPKFEIIVVDDGSTDSSDFEAKRALDRVPKSIARQYVRQKNAGVAAARNNGIAKARGRYICCLDADDKIDPHFLNRLSAALDSDPSLGIAYSDFVPFGVHEGRPWQGYVQCSEYDFAKLRGGNFIPCCNLFRRIAWERTGGYKDINPSWEDYELWLNMGKMGWHGRRVNQPLFYYRKLDKMGRDFESQGQEKRLRAIVNSYHRDLYPPLVSVVIPCYNHSHYLGEAIESVLAQTIPDLEIVVVDDGNEDEEAQAIQEVIRRYGNVRLVVHDYNRGLATARNTGVAASQGQWIVPLDADDKIAPEFIERTLTAIKSNPRLFAYTDSYIWWQNGIERLERIEADEYDFVSMLTRITWPCTVLYHRDAWKAAGGYKARMSQAGGWEDWEFVITLGELGICGQRVPEPLFYYRQHSQEQMRYGAVGNKAALQEVIRQLHPATVRGEFPMGCCGGGGRTAVTRSSPTVTRAVNTTPNGNGIPIRYVGGQQAPATWRGAVTGYPYQFGLAEPLQYVHPDDAPEFLRLSATFIQVTA